MCKNRWRPPLQTPMRAKLNCALINAQCLPRVLLYTKSANIQDRQTEYLCLSYTYDKSFWRNQAANIDYL